MAYPPHEPSERSKAARRIVELDATIRPDVVLRGLLGLLHAAHPTDGTPVGVGVLPDHPNGDGRLVEWHRHEDPNNGYSLGSS